MTGDVNAVGIDVQLRRVLRTPGHGRTAFAHDFIHIGAGCQRVVDRRKGDSIRDEGQRRKGVIVLVHRPPIATVNKDHQRIRASACGQEQIKLFGGFVAIGKIGARLENCQRPVC